MKFYNLLSNKMAAVHLCSFSDTMKPTMIAILLFVAIATAISQSDARRLYKDFKEVTPQVTISYCSGFVLVFQSKRLLYCLLSSLPQRGVDNKLYKNGIREYVMHHKVPTL